MVVISAGNSTTINLPLQPSLIQDFNANHPYVFCIYIFVFVESLINRLEIQYKVSFYQESNEIMFCVLMISYFYLMKSLFPIPMLECSF